MKMVWILIIGKNPVRFFEGEGRWSTNEDKAKVYTSKALARRAAYDMQAHHQSPIVVEGVYRRAA